MNQKINPNQNPNFNLNNFRTKDSYSAAYCLIVSLVYGLLSAYIPFAFFSKLEESLFEGISLFAALPGIFVFVRLMGAVRYAVPFIMLELVFFFLFGSFAVSALISAAAVSVSALSCMFLRAEIKEARFLPFLSVAAAAVATYIWLGSIACALSCAALLPAAIVLAYSLGKDAPRIAVICRVSFVLLFTAAAAVALLIVVRYNSDFTVIGRAITYARETFIRLFNESFSEVAQTIGLSVSEADIASVSSAMINTVFNLAPAAIITVANLGAFMFQYYAALTLAHSEKEEKKLINLFSFKMSTASAVIFLVFLLLSAVLSIEAVDVYSITALNLAMIFMPGMIYTAMITLKHFTVVKKPSCFGFFIYIGAFMLFFYATAPALIISSISGAAVIIVNAAKIAAARKNK